MYFLPKRQWAISLLLLVILFSVSTETYAQKDTDTERRIEPRDHLTITVLKHHELSMDVVVYPDGTTSYPILSSIYVEGMTIEQLTTLVETLLAPLISQPKVFISISGIKNIYCEVHGAVLIPGKLFAEDPLSLQEVITRAGGLLEDADQSAVQIRREFGDTQEIITIDLLEYLQADTLEPILIHNEDMIFVPVQSNIHQIRVIGAVNLPGVFTYIPNENILDLIYRAGGFANMSNQNEIKLYTRSESERYVEVIDIEQYLEQGRVEKLPVIRKGDIVVVPRNPEWKNLSFWSQIIRDLALLLSSAVIVARL